MTESTASATERVGRYQLLEPIGNGPTGVVWRAKVFGVAGFERQFAVKRFLPEVTATPAAAQALSAAARAYGGLEHPRIARMTEFGVAQGQTFTAVELVAGMDAMRLLAEARLAGATLAAGGVLALISQVARAIGYAHGRGISHLGLAPTNVIVTPDGDVKVTDFAVLASTLPAKPVESPRLAARIAYLAPEQLAAEATSAATDVFALGVLAYELVTGQRTFRGDTAQQIAQAIMAGPPAEPALPRPIVRVLQRCLARSPFERFPDARAFADALDAALRVAPVPGSRKDIGAQVKATLDRIAELHDNQLSGVLALNLGTGPIARLDAAGGPVATLGRDSRDLPQHGSDPETVQYVRPDLEVPGPSPLVALDGRGPAPAGSAAEGRRGLIDGRGPAPAGSAAEGRGGVVEGRGGLIDTATTRPDLPKTTMPGVLAPIAPPKSIPAIPPFRRAGSASEAEGSRVGARIATDVASVPSLPTPQTGTGRVPIPTIKQPPPAVPPSLFERPRAATAPPPIPTAPIATSTTLPALPPGALATIPDELAAIGEDSLDGLDALGSLGQLGEDPPTADMTTPRPRAIVDARTQPGVGMRPTKPALAAALPPPIPVGRAPSHDIKTDQLSPVLAEKLGLASTMPTGQIKPLVDDAYRAEAMAEFPDEVRSEYDAMEVASAPSVSQRLVAVDPPPGLTVSTTGSTAGSTIGSTTGSTAGSTIGSSAAAPSAPAPRAPSGPNPTAPLHLGGPPPTRARPARWPWLVAGALTLCVIGGISYVVVSTVADDGQAVGRDAGAVATVRPPRADAAVAAVAPDAPAAAPDAARVAAVPVDAAAVAVATPDAAVVAPVVVDAAVVAPTPIPPQPAAPSAPGDMLSILSTPPGAHVFVDGADQGVTPAKLPGTAGRHTAVLLLPGHDLYVAELDGHGAFTIPLKDVVPSTGPAGIKVLKCAPNRYYVTVDGKPTGQLCPTERIGCEVGAHTVETYDAVTGTRRKWDIQVSDTRLSYRVRVEP